eukprot:GILK01004470.1.p1 GENE.GILK01004470.1~~GILK01004470.1.p1  ORF type:complete len:374 (+),score=53.00 GILK01004470.1:115-1122(+)
MATTAAPTNKRRFVTPIAFAVFGGGAVIAIISYQNMTDNRGKHPVFARALAEINKNEQLVKYLGSPITASNGFFMRGTLLPNDFNVNCKVSGPIGKGRMYLDAKRREPLEIGPDGRPVDPVPPAALADWRIDHLRVEHKLPKYVQKVSNVSPVVILKGSIPEPPPPLLQAVAPATPATPAIAPEDDWAPSPVRKALTTIFKPDIFASYVLPVVLGGVAVSAYFIRKRMNSPYAPVLGAVLKALKDDKHITDKLGNFKIYKSQIVGEEGKSFANYRVKLNGKKQNGELVFEAIRVLPVNTDPSKLGETAWHISKCWVDLPRGAVKVHLPPLYSKMT